MASRPRRLLLLLRRTLVGLGLLLVFLGWSVQTDLFSRQAARLLERFVADLTGERVLIGGVWVNVLKRRREFKKLTGAPSTDASAPPPDRFPWERLRIVSAALTLETRGGTLELEGLDLAPEHGQDTMALGLERVAVRMGDIAQAAHGVYSPGLVLTPSHVKIPALNIAFRPELVRLVPEFSGDPDATGTIQDAPPGWADPPSLSVRGALEADLAGALTGDLHVDGQLSGWNASLPEGLAIDGALSADVTLRGTADAPLLSGALRLPDGRVWTRYESGYTFIYELGALAVSWRLDDRVIVLEPFTDQWA